LYSLVLALFRVLAHKVRESVCSLVVFVLYFSGKQLSSASMIGHSLNFATRRQTDVVLQRVP